MQKDPGISSRRLNIISNGKYFQRNENDVFYYYDIKYFLLICEHPSLLHQFYCELLLIFFVARSKLFSSSNKIAVKLKKICSIFYLIMI